MFEYVCRRRGAISIFLVIVLVPMLMLSSVMVDMSRLRLAKAVATSSGDLTLNTALTNYDAVLKDMYGLFATSQNMDELFENLENYYRKSIESAGVAPAEADDYVGQIMSMLKSSTGTDDLLNMNVTEFTVTKPTGASLANPAILKTQIVNFMKYRAPLNLGSGFLEALKSMKNLSKQTDLVNQKNEFYEEQKGLLEELEAVWRDIQNYQYADAEDGFPTGNYLTSCGTTLDADASTLKNELIPDTIDYLYNKSIFYNPSCSISTSTGKMSLYGTNYSFGNAYDEDNPATADDVLDCLQMVLLQLSILDDVSDDDTYKLLINCKPQSDDIVKIYTITKFYTLSNGYGYTAYVKSLFQALADLQNAYDNCDAEELENTKIKYNSSTYSVYIDSESSLSLASFVQSQLNAHYTLSGSSDLQIFNGFMASLSSYHSALKSTVDNKALSVNKKFDALRDHAYEYDVFVAKKISNLTNAISKLNTIRTELDSPNSAYNQALSEWETAANGLSDETMGKNDKAEIEKLKKVLTVSKVDTLIARLTKAKTTLETVKTQIAAYKYGSTSWKDIANNSGYTKVKSLMSPFDSAIQSIVPVNNNSYNDVINDVKATVVSGQIKESLWNDQTSPDLTKNQSELYTWLYNNYYDKNMNYDAPAPTESGVDSGEADIKDTKESLKATADSNNKKGNEEANSSTKVATSIKDYQEYLPSSEWENLETAIKSGEIQTNQDELLKSNSNAVDNLLGALMDAVGSMATDLRDKMYFADYIMRMFSYDTFEAEITKEYGGNLSDFTAWYEKAEGSNEYTVKADYKKYAAEAVTLTNVSINPNMNYLYGSEIEYIVYGGEDMAANKLMAYGSIFAIRFAFNTVYAFTDAELNNTAMAAATAMFGVPPLTPLIPIAKIAIIIGLSIAETAYDLYVIKTGDAVPLIKNSKTWTMKLSSAVKELAGEIAEEVADAVITEGHKLLNDVLEMTDEELGNMIESGTGEISKIANAAVNSTIDKFRNYANETLQEMVSLCNAANMEAMMQSELRDAAGNINLGSTTDKIQYVINGLDAWLATQGTSVDDAVYEVKKLAVDYLKSNGGEKIKLIFDAINTANQVSDGTLLNQYLDQIQESVNTEIDTLASSVGTKLNELKTQAMDKIKKAADEGVEKLRQEVSNQIGNVFGTSSSKEKGTNTVVSSLLSWSYSDYLMLFLLVSILINEEAVILRTADIIELNMQHMNGEYASITTTETVTVSRFFGLWKTKKEVTKTEANENAFQLDKAYTYLTIEATLQVKPLLMTLPFMGDTVENQLTGTNWYEVKYKGTLGY